MARTIQGDTEAYGELVRRHFRTVHLLAFSRVHDRDTAEDVAQDTFLRAFLSLDKLRTPGRFRAWVNQIARHLAVNRRLHESTALRQAIPLEDLAGRDPASDTPRPDEVIAGAEEDKALRDALQSLPVSLREIVLLRFVDERSNVEIANALQVHPATIGRQLEKALALMKEGLEPLLRGRRGAIRPSERGMVRTLAAVAAISALPAASRASLAHAAGSVARRAARSVRPGALSGAAALILALFHGASSVGRLGIAALAAGVLLGAFALLGLREPRVLTNSLGMRFRLVPAGSFLMGSPDTEAGREAAEGPVHRVTVPRFYMGETEVTVEQCARFLEATGHPAPLYWAEAQSNHPLFPALAISWSDAVAFCDWLSSVEGVTYRLPSEAEWEYACRAGSTSANPWGDTTTLADANFDPRGGVTNENPPRAVGQYPANDFGLFDMAGNAMEWCQDLWHPDYGGAPTDGGAWMAGGSADIHVVRGGSFYSLPSHCRSAYRTFCGHPQSHYNFGFRVVRQVD